MFIIIEDVNIHFNLLSYPLKSLHKHSPLLSMGFNKKYYYRKAMHQKSHVKYNEKKIEKEIRKFSKRLNSTKK